MNTACEQLRAVLVGNPNTGKSTLFNGLSGLRQHVGNYPGVTIETKKGHFHHLECQIELVDLPGTYSLAPRSPDELAAVEIVLGQRDGESPPDVIVSIVDASNLERNLFLTTQVLELGAPVVVALNMMDVAEGHGLKIDVPRLEKQLGVRVVAIQANKKKGLDDLKNAIVEAGKKHVPPTCPSFPEAFEREVNGLQEKMGSAETAFFARRLLLDSSGGHAESRLAARHGDTLVEAVRAARQRLIEAGLPLLALEAKTRYAWIRGKVGDCLQRPAERPVTATDRIDRVLTHRVWGTLFFLGVMFFVFVSIFFFAKPLMEEIDKAKGALADWAGGFLTTGPLKSLIVDGIIEGVGGVVIFLPQILILFIFVAVLEDSGYMSRAAYLMDRLMARAGLSGKSFIPMLSSVACAIPGVLATRVIENRRDRLTTILVAPLMSCSARLPVYTLMIAAFMSEYSLWTQGFTMFCMYLLGIVLAPLVAFALKRTLLKGETPTFVMEMPMYKVPSLATVTRRVSDAGWEFIRRAGTIIMASMIVVWALLYFPRTDEQGNFYDVRIAELKEEAEQLKADEQDEAAAAKEEAALLLRGQWKRQSYLGRMGHAIEPVVRPLGWDWKIGMAALASFPAREVIVGTMAIIYNLDEGEEEEKLQASLGDALRNATWDHDPQRKVFTLPVALSIMVFFALCAQCASTLAVIKRETNSWFWPVFTFTYMTVLAYVGAFIVYQVGTLLMS